MEMAGQLHNWQIRPQGTEGYEKAEVTVGGVDTDELSSKTMESRKVPGLYFVGEVVDVTGQLGGYISIGHGLQAMLQVSMPEQRKIILASASPGERDSRENRAEFSVDAGDYKEDMDLALKPRQLARFLSSEKAKAVAVKYASALVIAADTFIVFQGSLLGKPHTREEARRMLTLLNGRQHSVLTGFTVIDTLTGRSCHAQLKQRCFLKNDRTGD